MTLSERFGEFKLKALEAVARERAELNLSERNLKNKHIGAPHQSYIILYNVLWLLKGNPT